VGSTYKAAQGYLLEVLDASGRRVKRLRIRPPQSLGSEPSAD
jgi:CBS domain containing-hemolysin-like protein